MGTITQGLASGPALCASPRRNCLRVDSADPRARVRARGQIGLGARAIVVTDPVHLGGFRRRLSQPVKKRGRTMQLTTLYASLVGALAVSATAFGISTAVDSPRSLMSPVDYGAAQKVIEAEARTRLHGCRDRHRPDMDVR